MGVEVDVQAVAPLGRIQTEGRGGRENEEGEEKGTWPARGTKKKYASRLEVPPGREWSVGGTLNLRATAFPSFALSLRL